MFCLRACVCTVCTLGGYEDEKKEGIGSPGFGVLHDSEPPCGCWESNPGPLQGQEVLLTIEPALYPLKYIFNNWHLIVLYLLPGMWSWTLNDVALPVPQQV